MIVNNWSEEIGMSSSVFSKFVKKHANKTYIEILQELRIDCSYKLLTETDIPVSQIAYESGYNNIANFKRQFKSITGKTPLEFKTGIIN